MTIDEVIRELEQIREDLGGDVACVIEVMTDHMIQVEKVGELSVEDRLVPSLDHQSGQATETVMFIV